MVSWFAESWFVLLQSVGIIGSLVFTGLTLRHDIRTRRITNLITITQQHREIWTKLYDRPELARVTKLSVDLQATPMTTAEELFVHLLILHLNCSYHALKDKLFIKPEGLQKDLDRFFSCTIPKLVWERTKGLHDSDFVEFVEKNRGTDGV